MAKATKKKPGQGLGRGKGRVPLELADRKSEYLRVRLTPGEKAELENAADRAGKTVSAYVLDTALRLARKK